MSQNGDDAEVRDAMINPVQRRESSAARFLKHFRPDRNNPAYHSEGKGLRKRRNWASERQLTTNSDHPAASGNDPATPAASSAVAQRPVASSNAPQRSHSFSEPDASGGPAGGASRTAFKENSGMRESFRWRFGSKSSSSSKSSSTSSDHPPKGGDTCKSPAGNPGAPPAPLTRTKSEGLPSSGVNDSASPATTTTTTTAVSTAQQPPPCNNNLNNAPAAGNNWSQLHRLPGGHFNNKSPSKKCIHDSTTVVDGRSSGVHIQLQQQPQEHQAGSPSEPIYSNGKAHATAAPTAGSRVVVNYYASTSSSAGADADYVNYEMFASHQYNWSNHQKQLEPDLIRNLPYQQQQQQQQQQSASTVAAPVNGHSPSKLPGNSPYVATNPSPHHRHSNRVHPR